MQLVAVSQFHLPLEKVGQVWITYGKRITTDAHRLVQMTQQPP